MAKPPRCLTVGLLLLFGVIAVAELGCYAGRDGPPISDFFGIWSWSRFVATEGAAALYDSASLHRFQQDLNPIYTDTYYPYLYPPTYLLLIWPLAHLPLVVARLLWSGITLAVYLVAINGLRWRPSLLVAAVVAPATVLCLICGQNGLLTAALMIGGLRCAASRPLLAGALLGLLTYKPHLAVLVPVALIAARLWRTLLAAAISASVCLAASSLLFGFELWADWLDAQSASWATIDTFTTDHLGMIPTVSAALRQLGCSHPAVIGGQFIATIAAASSLWILCRRGLTVIALPVAALLATPYAFIYDLPMVSGAALVALAEHDPPPLGVALLGAALLLPQLMFNLQGGGMPFAAPVLVILLLWLLLPTSTRSIAAAAA